LLGFRSERPEDVETAARNKVEAENKKSIRRRHVEKLIRRIGATSTTPPVVPPVTPPTTPPVVPPVTPKAKP
jgi:hypothetical protein